MGAELLFSAHFLIPTMVLNAVGVTAKSERDTFFHNRFYKSCLLLVVSDLRLSKISFTERLERIKFLSHVTIFK